MSENEQLSNQAGDGNTAAEGEITGATSAEPVSADATPAIPVAAEPLAGEISTASTGISTVVSEEASTTAPESPAVTVPAADDSATGGQDMDQNAPTQPFTINHTGANEFRVYEGETAIGKVLSPTDAAVVLGWLQSIDSNAH